MQGGRRVANILKPRLAIQKWCIYPHSQATERWPGNGDTAEEVHNYRFSNIELCLKLDSCSIVHQVNQ